eukprot:Gregarina_sp_Poly_1__10268@NODE_719_length_6614_cov_137_436383_g541_i0_p4_GENE_NODE_719_length_6614_cov_137_436383_g541_i0NODE_719_length_6614_cov_137_436383_g541_i0_p4_ORF_typecomplete_len150_score8_00zfC3HC4_3/PF13920_6/3_8e05zfC3HC4_3/PF13920_6/81ProkRING_4/PF14447_6/2_1e02ProkRING_4/PF14447_6/0_0001ProkRING_4/PF14447_6/84zfRING_5/PF14634_6/0_0035zfRING_5/PF14634_6/2e02DUF2197/PF09963_9/3_9DUF2197/PF09963_9/2_6e03DUF2197/PF09963_9/0_06RecR/PF02132_15/8_1RecR/PF02132_15/0_4RecR/PF02132_15/2e02
MVRLFCPICASPSYYRFRLDPCCHWMCATCFKRLEVSPQEGKLCSICRTPVTHVRPLPVIPSDDPPRTTGVFGEQRTYYCPQCSDRIFQSQEGAELHWKRAHSRLFPNVPPPTNFDSPKNYELLGHLETRLNRVQQE